MRINTIASILPVPNVMYENDYVFTLAEEIKKIHPKTEFQFSRPSPYLPFVQGKKWKIRRKISKIKEYKIGKEQVQVLPYPAMASKSWLFALSSTFLLLLNKRKLKASVSDIDLSHAHFIFPDGIIAYFLKQKFDIPYTISIHNEMRIFSSRFGRMLALRILKNATELVVINPKIKGELLQLFPFKNISFIGHGIPNKAIREIQNNGTPKTRILTVGILNGRKNYIRTLLAIKQISELHAIEYVIVGEGPDYNKIKAKINALQLNTTVKLIPKVKHSEIFDFMAGFDIFLLASKHETWGRVYIEAMAAGLPVILTENTGVHGIITAGKNAMVVDPKNIDNISEKLIELIENPSLRYDLATNGQQLALNLTWDNIAKKYYSIYQNLLGVV